MMKYILYKTNGNVEVIESEAPLKLEKLQELVGGYIEFAPEESDGSQAIVNEDGISEMLPRNPFFRPAHQPYYLGNVLLGKNVRGDEGTEFHGFDDVELKKYTRKPLGYDQSIFKKNAVFTIISIGDSMGNTTKSELKCTGEFHRGSPVFKRVGKGNQRKFTLRNLEDGETMFFEGMSLPFKIDGEAGNTIRMNSLLNLVGDADTIKLFIQKKNLNPFFASLDRVNHVDGEKETLLFTDVPTWSKLVQDRREKQIKNVK